MNTLKTNYPSKSVFIWAFLIFLHVSVFSQGTDLTLKETKRTYTYSNAIYDLVKKGNIKKAIEYTQFVSERIPVLFEMQVHSNFSQWVLRNEPKKHALLNQYFEGLSALKNQNISNMVQSLYWFSIICRSNNLLQINSYVDSMLILANRGIHYPSRNERYMLGLFVYQENSFLDSGNKKKLFNKAIENLNAFDQNEYNNGQNRAWFTQRASVRNMLAFCNYQLAMVEKDSIKKDEYFNACFQNAPDQSDITKGGGDVFNDNGFLIHKYTTKSEYLKKYYLYLSETGNGKALFDGWLKHTLVQPTKENYKNTKAVFDSLFPKQNFDSVWHNAVAKILLPKPADARMLVKDTSRTWTLIDFWGTWCKPCIIELPEVQKINKEKVQTGDLGLFTYSYNSTQLNAFMQKNKYDFPVEEVDEKVIVDYKVIGFPTKFLVYKTGQYIPLSLHNWKEEIEVFTGK